VKIAANGITIHAEESGDGDLAIVFLHYWGGRARTWCPVMAALPTTLRAVAFDARGWGQSDRPDHGYDIATMADDAQQAIAALGLSRYVLVGHSMGGKVAQLLASRRPAGLVGLALVAPSPAQGKSLSEPEREAMRDAYMSPEALDWTIDNVLAARPLAPTLRQQVIADTLTGASVAKAAWIDHAIAEDVSGGLAQIDVPILVVGGEKDRVDGVDLLRSAVLPSLPGAAMTIIPDVGHLVPLEAPRELAETLVSFVDRVTAIEGSPASCPADVAHRFDEAFNRGDLDAVISLFHPDATMRMTDGSVIAGGPVALRSALGALIAARPTLRNTVRRVITSGSIALLLLDWEIRVSTPAGSEMVQRGVATQVVERCGDGGWRLRIANPLGVD
jgi:uncharacterized protein (TIGR02246 family)